jgi:hypothetical protein
MKFKMHWNPFVGEWFLCDMLGQFMEKLPDCGNFRLKYPGLKKGTILPDGTPSVINVIDDSPATVVALIEHPGKDA